MWELLIPAFSKVLDKLLPDPAASADAKLKLAELAQSGQLSELNMLVDLSKAQIAVNQAEAQSSDRFRGSWRPLIGYVLGLALAYQYLLNPLFIWGCTIWFPTITPPKIVLDDQMWQLLLGMLGMSAVRSWEKVKSPTK